MPEKLTRSVVVTPCCRHHSLTERPLLRHSWICAAHSCSSARCFNSALVILTPHNTTVAKPFATFRYYCLMCVYARLGLTVTDGPFQIRSSVVKNGSLPGRWLAGTCPPGYRPWRPESVRWSAAMSNRGTDPAHFLSPFQSDCRSHCWTEHHQRYWRRVSFSCYVLKSINVRTGSLPILRQTHNLSR